jgi:hypothetical protein
MSSSLSESTDPGNEPIGTPGRKNSLTLPPNNEKVTSCACTRGACRLMVTVNEDVGSGIANGATCRLRRIKLLEGASTERMTIDGYCLNTTMMSDVEWIECEFEGGLFTGTFRLKPQRRHTV